MTTTLNRKESRTHNSTYPKGGVSCSKDSFVVNGSLVFQIKFCGKSPALRVAAKRYRKPYSDIANIKQTDMKLTFLDNIAERLTARPTSQRNEVLFFATAHFLFFNFYATAQNTLSLFLPTHKPNIKKMKECFFSSLQLRMKNLHLLNNQILPLNF